MNTIEQLKDELSEEYTTTKKFFKVFPDGKNDYAPHEKSMKLISLSRHIVDIFSCPKVMLNTSDLDISKERDTDKIQSKMQLEAHLDKNYQDSLMALEQATSADLEPNWSISMNGKKLHEQTKFWAIRHSLKQMTHHRAQLGVYFRLLNIPLPGSYGPSADAQNF